MEEFFFNGKEVTNPLLKTAITGTALVVAGVATAGALALTGAILAGTGVIVSATLVGTAILITAPITIPLSIIALIACRI